MSIFNQVISRLVSCPAFSVDVTACDSFDEHDIPSLEQVGKAFRMLAFDVILRNREHYILDDMSAQVLESAGLMKIGRFVEFNHPMASSDAGEYIGTLTPAGLKAAERLIAYETTLRERHMTAKDLAKWWSLVRSYGR